MKMKPVFIAFSTQKGGVGKTTFTVLAASYLHYVCGYNVLVVDCDYPQFSINEMRKRDAKGLETNGSLSVFPSADKRPATRGEMHLPPVYDGIPLTLILDGQMQERSMRIAGLEPGWLRRILQDHGVARDKDVLIATLDTQGSLLVQEKGEEGRLLTFNVIEPGQVRW